MFQVLKLPSRKLMKFSTCQHRTWKTWNFPLSKKVFLLLSMKNLWMENCINHSVTWALEIFSMFPAILRGFLQLYFSILKHLNEGNLSLHHQSLMHETADDLRTSIKIAFPFTTKLQHAGNVRGKHFKSTTISMRKFFDSISVLSLGLNRIMWQRSGDGFHLKCYTIFPFTDLLFYSHFYCFSPCRSLQAISNLSSYAISTLDDSLKNAIN